MGLTGDLDVISYHFLGPGSSSHFLHSLSIELSTPWFISSPLNASRKKSKLGNLSVAINCLYASSSALCTQLQKVRYTFFPAGRRSMLSYRNFLRHFI